MSVSSVRPSSDRSSRLDDVTDTLASSAGEERAPCPFLLHATTTSLPCLLAEEDGLR